MIIIIAYLFMLLAVVSIFYFIRKTSPAEASKNTQANGKIFFKTDDVDVDTDRHREPRPKPKSDDDGLHGRQVSTDSAAWVNAHNKLRSQFNYPDLVWDETLAQAAKNHANANQRLGHMFHGDQVQNGCRGTGNRCGQNIEKVWGMTIKPADAVNNWYNECPLYPGYCNKGQDLAKSGHYTQVMWKSARKVGCGISDAGTYGVCNYDYGNMLDQCRDNVPRECIKT
jgi:hypothetical protein